MSGFLLDFTSTVICAHGGSARAMTPNPHVLLAGQPTVLQPDPWTVSGCPNPPPNAGTGPCLTAQWITGTVRVTSGGRPLLLQTSASVAMPPGTPLQVVQTQTRVQAT